MRHPDRPKQLPQLEEQFVFDLRWGNPEIVKHMLRIQRELDRRATLTARKIQCDNPIDRNNA